VYIIYDMFTHKSESARGL